MKPTRKQVISATHKRLNGHGPRVTRSVAEDIAIDTGLIPPRRQRAPLAPDRSSGPAVVGTPYPTTLLCAQAKTSERWYARKNWKIIRFLQADYYDNHGNIRTFIYRLRDSDLRPRGRFLSGMTDASFDQYNAMPFGCWIETSYPPA